MRSARLIALVPTIAVVLLLAACAAKGPVYVDDKGTYELSSTVSAFQKADVSTFAKTPTSEATRLRHDALAALRGDGKRASSASNLITEVFPSGTRSVPVYVERARVDGHDSLIIVEAYGPKSGTLQDKRLWVLNMRGDVLFSATR